jgi:hypothetical protein
MRTGAVTVIALFSAAAVLTAAAAARPRWRRRLPKVIGLAAGGVLAAFLVGRGAAEFFIVHYGDPASYRNAWGGPSLAGVFAVHSGPAVAILLGAGGYVVRWHRARRGNSGRVTSGSGNSGPGPSGTGAARDVRPVARTGGHR